MGCGSAERVLVMLDRRGSQQEGEPESGTQSQRTCGEQELKEERTVPASEGHAAFLHLVSEA